MESMKAHRVIDDQKMYQQFCRNVADITQQSICAMLYAFELNGYDEEQILEAYRAIKSVYDLPSICGKDLEGNDVINHIENKYGIDLSELTIRIESFDEYRKQLS